MDQGYSAWKSTLSTGADIPHYYGDYVRILFLVVAVLLFVTTALWGDPLPFVNVTLQIAAPLLLVLLAGLTTARSEVSMIANATVAGISVILLEFAAVIYGSIGENGTILFAAREVAAILLLGALYFSVKTIRGMASGKLGHRDSPLEFSDDDDDVSFVSRQEGQRQDVSNYDA